MNLLERKWANLLTDRVASGEVLWWCFESVNLKIAPNTFYCPDFVVMLSDGEIIIEEVKGRMMEDAWMKLKIVADRFPFRVIVVTNPKKDVWEKKEVGV